jgi:hypothetical protein
LVLYAATFGGKAVYSALGAYLFSFSTHADGAGTAMSEERCLHCDINDIVREHIEAAGDAPVSLPDLIAKVSESLVDLILLGPEDQWSNLLASAIRDVGHVFLEKRGATESDTTH